MAEEGVRSLVSDPLREGLLVQIGYLNPEQRRQILQAYEFACKAHEGQYRLSGEPYITHPVAVAGILASIRLDAPSVMAALLHDVIEDCAVTKETVAKRFSSVVAELVDGVSKISAIKFESKAMEQAENFRKIVLAMTKDIRVILVKLADRLHNMRTLSVLSTKKRRRIATETLEIYAPIANRLGMHSFCTEFEDLGFVALYPMRAELIGRAVKGARSSRKKTMDQLLQTIKQSLAEYAINGYASGRQKHLYNIYQKMKAKRKSFSEIMDVYELKIVVDSIDMCYRVLGLVHNLYKPVPGRFKDYIAIPKVNGYQSLHTTLIGPKGVSIDVQIQTQEMECITRHGIVAQWCYQAPMKQDHQTHTRAQQWMNSLLELQQHAGSSIEFIENVKINLFPDEVYVFTPQGDIYELPRGATPIDFAYAVHTDLGNTCIAARIDQRLSPLSTPLDSGQTVQIITATGSSPVSAWLSFVVTSKARSNIRHYLKVQRKSESIHLGRRLLEKALASLGVKLEDVQAEQFSRAAKQANCTDFNDLLEKIGLGHRVAPVVARYLRPGGAIAPVQVVEEPLAIKGSEGVIVNFAKCCYPIPGDSVVGFFDIGSGMTVHVDSCHNVSHALKDNPDKCVEVSWDMKTTGSFAVNVRIEMINKRGVLATIAYCIAECDANIEAIHMGETNSQLSVVDLILGVNNRVHLARIIRRLRVSKSAVKITRMKR